MTEYNNLIRSLNSKQEYKNDFENTLKRLIKAEPDYFKYQPFKGRKLMFDCGRNLTKETSNSVHRLRPQDIKVIGAMGDSLTAGIGANALTILGLLLEYRGRVWSAGGDSTVEDILTVPNILKKFNPSITGFNQGIDISLFSKEGKGFNVAVSGKEANNMPIQARRLVQRLKESTTINYAQDWKMITVFIGGNDICEYCNNRNLYTPVNYINFIKDALDILHNEVPRAFVNLVVVLSAGQVRYLNIGLVCSIIHQYVCPCAAFPKSKEQAMEIDSLTLQYQTLTEKLIESGRYDTRDDFTVVVQPFFKNFEVPRFPSGEVDLSYFAPDCFHLSTKGQGMNYFFNKSI